MDAPCTVPTRQTTRARVRYVGASARGRALRPASARCPRSAALAQTEALDPDEVRAPRPLNVDQASNVVEPPAASVDLATVARVTSTTVPRPSYWVMTTRTDETAEADLTEPVTRQRPPTWVEV